MDDPSPFQPPRDGAASRLGGGTRGPLADTAASTAEQSTPSHSDETRNPITDPTAEPLSIVDDLRILDDLDRVRIFGLDLVDAASLDPVVEEILNGPRRDDEIQPVVLTPNVDIVVQLDQAPEGAPELDLFRRAQFCLPDGQPLVLVSRLLGTRIRARLPGSELFERLWPRIVAEKTAVVVVASSDEIADLLHEHHPEGCYIVPPMFHEDDEDAVADIVTEVLAAAQAVGPRLVMVGIGNPKDARIIAALLRRWNPDRGPKPLCLGLGGSFSMHLGLKKRAPRWIQKIGMEWFYRFMQEPRRLFHRYFVRDMAFIGIVRRQWLANKAGR